MEASIAPARKGKACEVRGLKLSGWPAFLMYLSVHLYYLSGVLGRRLRVLNSWIMIRLGAVGRRVIEGKLELVERAPATAEAPEWEPTSSR